jgi:hypothetical protein
LAQAVQVYLALRTAKAVRPGRFPNSCALDGSAKGAFFFHPIDEDLSLGTPVEEKPLERGGFGVQQL